MKSYMCVRTHTQTHMHCFYSRLDNYQQPQSGPSQNWKQKRKTQIQSGDEMKLWQSLYCNMQLDPSEKLFSSLIPSSAHIYSSSCVFHLKCPLIREKSAKISRCNRVLRLWWPVKQSGFPLTCTDSRRSEDDWQWEGGHHGGFRGFCEFSMRGSLAKVICQNMDMRVFSKWQRLCSDRKYVFAAIL